MKKRKLSMTHLLDTSALMAHYLGEPGALTVQALFNDEEKKIGASVLTFFEYESRLQNMGLSPP
jgi:predicted nucleic acid-binding protein